MIVDVAAFVVPKWLVGLPPHVLKPKLAFVWLVVTAKKQFLRPVLRCKWLFIFRQAPEAILDGGLLYLLAYVAVQETAYYLEELNLWRTPKLSL